MIGKEQIDRRGESGPHHRRSVQYKLFSGWPSFGLFIEYHP